MPRSEQPTENATHLHLDDHPHTLALLSALLGAKATRPGEDTSRIGYQATEHGAWVDWERLAHSWLSSTEIAVVRIAQGCAVLEARGGPPPNIAGDVVDAVSAVCHR